MVALNDTHDRIAAIDAPPLRARFGDVDLSETVYTDVKLRRCRIADVNMSDVIIGDADPTKTTIRGARVSDLFAAYEKQRPER